MWNKSLFLVIRVRVRWSGRRLRLVIPFAVYVLSGLLLSCEPMLELLPGAFGRKVRGVSDAALGVLYGIMDSEPQCFVHVDTENEEEKVLVDLRTCGFFAGREEEL